MVVRHSGLAKMILKLLCTETMLWSTDEKMWGRLSHETTQEHREAQMEAEGPAGSFVT